MGGGGGRGGRPPPPPQKKKKNASQNRKGEKRKERFYFEQLRRVYNELLASMKIQPRSHIRNKQEISKNNAAND